MSIGTRLYNALTVFAIAVTVLGVVLGLVLWQTPPDTKVSITWPIVIGAALLVVCFTLMDMLRTAIRETETTLPRILRFLEDDQAGSSGRLLLVEPSNLLALGMAVSLYAMHNDFEILIGDGVVQVVQQDHKIQIAVMTARRGTEPIWANLMANKPDALKASLIRPGNQYRTSNRE
jgi:hypothetical protein